MSGLGVTSAHAGSVRGQISFATERVEPAADGLWRIENGILAVSARIADPRSECVVLLEPKGPARSKDTGKPEPVTAALRGLRLHPVVLLAPLGAMVEIKNEDRVPHTLAVVGNDADVFPAHATPAGATRSERPKRPGVFALRDEEFPHVRGWLVVTDTAIAARPDEHWAWKLEAPEGEYTLKVLYRGGVALERAISVGAKSVEVNLTLPASAR